jgi:hypothetical protein
MRGYRRQVLYADEAVEMSRIRRMARKWRRMAYIYPDNADRYIRIAKSLEARADRIEAA